jgi:hypothetical protein
LRLAAPRISPLRRYYGSLCAVTLKNTLPKRLRAIAQESVTPEPDQRLRESRSGGMADKNQTPEQKARDSIDKMLELAGWKVQSNKKIDFSAGLGIAVREYQTDVGPADYVLFVDKKAVGGIEAKPEDWGQKLTTVEEQSGGYAQGDTFFHFRFAPKDGVIGLCFCG